MRFTTSPCFCKNHLHDRQHLFLLVPKNTKEVFPPKELTLSSQEFDILVLQVYKVKPVYDTLRKTLQTVYKKENQNHYW